MQELPTIEFERAIFGTPENCKRGWISIFTYSDEDNCRTVILWQEGAWWCMQEQYEGKVFASTWGNASHIMQELQMYGHVAGLDHIDFNAGNWNA